MRLIALSADELLRYPGKMYVAVGLSYVLHVVFPQSHFSMSRSASTLFGYLVSAAAAANRFVAHRAPCAFPKSAAADDDDDDDETASDLPVVVLLLPSRGAWPGGDNSAIGLEEEESRKGSNSNVDFNIGGEGDDDSDDFSRKDEPKADQDQDQDASFHSDESKKKSGLPPQIPKTSKKRSKMRRNDEAPWPKGGAITTTTVIDGRR